MALQLSWRNFRRSLQHEFGVHEGKHLVEQSQKDVLALLK
jgi:hypothetical protein